MPTLPADYFAAFDLPRKLVIDTAYLDKRRLELSRLYHPDRFSNKPIDEQTFATDMTSITNDGYRVLKDPVRRAEYLLKLEGVNIGEQTTKDVPPELLEEVFELNMALEEMREGDESARPSLLAAKQNFEQLLGRVDDDLQAAFVAHDGGQADTLMRIRGLLNRRRYVQNLVLEVERTVSGEAKPL